MVRKDGRAPHQMRTVRFQRSFVRGTAGSCLVDFGHTRVIVTACVEERVPPWLVGRGKGWVTAEYGMLPGSTGQRKSRPVNKQDGRSVEIQRLIGRSLRQAVDMKALGERTITIDADVLQADGGTRCAAINGGYVALHDALSGLVEKGLLEELPLRSSIQAISIGMVDGEVLMDLNYVEDSSAEFDFNLVTAAGSRIVEAGGSAERRPLSREQFDALLDMAIRGTTELESAQQAALRT